MNNIDKIRAANARIAELEAQLASAETTLGERIGLHAKDQVRVAELRAKMKQGRWALNDAVAERNRAFESAIQYERKAKKAEAENARLSEVADAAVDWADAYTGYDAGASGSGEYLRAREGLLRATVREYRAALAPKVEQEGDWSPWRPIETAPKDGSAILLLSAPYDDVVFGETVYHLAKAAIGHWNPDGTSWVDEMGRLGGDSYTLAVTGVWYSGGGWFQPNEVTHWMPIPTAPEAGAENEGE